jgi:hypothetical protein
VTRADITAPGGHVVYKPGLAEHPDNFTGPTVEHLRP